MGRGGEEVNIDSGVVSKKGGMIELRVLKWCLIGRWKEDCVGLWVKWLRGFCGLR